jgi:hypothetical protein
MAVLNPRIVVALVVGVGIGAALARRREAPAEPCCEQPPTGASCC